MSRSAQRAAQRAHLATLKQAEALANEGRVTEAESLCRQVLAAAPALPEATALLGFLASRQQRPAEARTLLEAAIVRRPDVPQWHHELRNLFRREYRLDAALAAGQEAVRLDPRSPRYRNGVAQIHLDRGEYAAALGHILDALALVPEDTESHLSLAHALLAQGDYRAGFAEYEWRFRAALYRNALPKLIRPQWNGMALPGRRLLLAADQGFGDGFHFARYVALAAQRCAGIVLLCREPQIPLFRRLPGVVACITDIRQAGEHAAFCWLASLPHVFGTTLDTIPAATPYIAPDPQRRAAWRDLMARLVPPGGLRVGLVWAGNPENSGDWRRSLRLAQLKRLAEVPGVRLVSLQLPIPEADCALAETMGLVDLAPRLADFGETAAAIGLLDLVISVDSGVAHLAGAMGVPTWVLLQQPADWRWLIGREDSPWYPSLRLFRQPVAGDWATPIGRLTEALAALTAGG